jgi:two-component system response regulator FixJ
MVGQGRNGRSAAVARVVYVVDSDAGVCRSLCAFLHAHGYAAESFDSGRSLLEALASRRPDCLVIEIALPDICGLDLVDRIAGEKRPPPIIALGSQADAPVAMRAMRSGAIDFLQKPFVSRALLKSIERAMGTATPPQSRTG